MGPDTWGNFRKECSVSLYENMLMLCRPRYLPSCSMHFKLLRMLEQKYRLLFSPRAIRLWNLFRLPKQRPHSYNSTIGVEQHFQQIKPKKDKMLDGNIAFIVIWCGLISTQRQWWILITGNVPTFKKTLLFFKRTSPELLPTFIGHNTRRSHLYIMGQINSLLRGRFGAQEATSAHQLSLQIKIYFKASSYMKRQNWNYISQ